VTVMAHHLDVPWVVQKAPVELAVDLGLAQLVVVLGRGVLPACLTDHLL